MNTTFWGLLIPFLGTTLGSACVFFMKKEMNDTVQRALLGFAAGVMVAASVWSLLIPAMEMSDSLGRLAFFPALAGFALGVVFASLLNGGGEISQAGALALSLGIAIQNFPEGAIISMPLRTEGNGKLRSFVYGTLSGAVEPLAAVITILLTSLVLPFLPYLLAFASGAMIYVVVEELLPEATRDEKTDVCTIGFAVGFALMMVLDVALG